MIKNRDYIENMTRQERIKKELENIFPEAWKIEKLLFAEMKLAFNYSSRIELTETQLDIAELLILRYYECGGQEIESEHI